MPDKKDLSLETVVRRLGVEDSIEFLEYALPRIIQRKKWLQEYLSTGDWEAASQCAYRMIGSVRLYGSAKLELLLEQVKLVSNGDIDPVSLQYELSVEFDKAINATREWLEAHTDA
jgi:hypothetical protein